MCNVDLLIFISGELHGLAVQLLVMPELMTTTGRYNAHPRSYSLVRFELYNEGLRPSVLSISVDQHLM